MAEELDYATADEWVDVTASKKAGPMAALKDESVVVY